MCNIETDMKTLKDKIKTYNGDSLIYITINEDFEANIISLEISIGYLTYELKCNNGYEYNNGTSENLIKEITKLLKEQNIKFKKKRNLITTKEDDIFIF